jgi:hypothetical protein
MWALFVDFHKLSNNLQVMLVHTCCHLLLVLLNPKKSRCLSQGRREISITHSYSPNMVCNHPPSPPRSPPRKLNSYLRCAPRTLSLSLMISCSSGMQLFIPSVHSPTTWAEEALLIDVRRPHACLEGQSVHISPGGPRSQDMRLPLGSFPHVSYRDPRANAEGTSF